MRLKGGKNWKEEGHLIANLYFSLTLTEPKDLVKSFYHTNQYLNDFFSGLFTKLKIKSGGSCSFWIYYIYTALVIILFCVILVFKFTDELYLMVLFQVVPVIVLDPADKFYLLIFEVIYSKCRRCWSS